MEHGEQLPPSLKPKDVAADLTAAADPAAVSTTVSRGRYGQLLTGLLSGSPKMAKKEIPKDDPVWQSIVSERLKEAQRASSALDDVPGTQERQEVLSRQIRRLLELLATKTEAPKKALRKGVRRTANLQQESNSWTGEFSRATLEEIAKNLGVSLADLDKADLADLHGKQFVTREKLGQRGFAKRAYLFDTQRKGDPLIHSMHFTTNGMKSPQWLYRKLRDEHESDDRISDYMWLGARVVNANYRSDSFECEFRPTSSYDIALEGSENAFQTQNVRHHRHFLAHHPARIGAAILRTDPTFPNPKTKNMQWSFNWIARMYKSPDVLSAMEDIPFDEDLLLLQEKFANIRTLADLQTKSLEITGFDRTERSVRAASAGFSGSSRKKH